jgi:hypothetical protein
VRAPDCRVLGEFSGRGHPEPNDVMHVLISNPVNAVLGNLTINNDDLILLP